MIKIFTSKKKWHTAANKYAFSNQSISRDEIFSKMKFGFIDSEGRKYFEFDGMDNIPEIRYEAIQITLQEISNRITDTDLDLFADTILKIVNDEKRKTKLSDISNMASALKKRRELLYEPELLFKLCAMIYIREDQDPRIFDESFEKEKIAQFKKDAAGGLYDFFYIRGMGKYFAGLKPSKSALMQLQEMENQTEQAKEFQNLLATLQAL